MDDKQLKMLISYCEDLCTSYYQRSLNAKKRNPKNADWHDGIVEGARMTCGKIIHFIKHEMEAK